MVLMKKTLFLLAAVILASCTPPTKKIGGEERLVSGKTLHTVLVKAPSFVLMTGGTAATWGMLAAVTGAFGGELSAASNGAELIRQNGVQPPSIPIAVELTKGLQRRYGVTLANTQIAQQSGDKSELQGFYKGADYTLVVDMSWRTAYNLLGSLAVMNQINIRLTEGAEGKVVAESQCNTKTPHDYSLDELRANNAQKLKDAVAEAERVCLRQLSADLGI
jgi:hypothetical protein